MNLKFLGSILIILGCILMTRKKIVLKAQYSYMFFMLIILAPSIKYAIELISYEKIYIIHVVLINMIVIIPLIISGINKYKNTYDIYNANSQMVVPIINNILEEKDIVYEEQEKSIYIKDYDDYIYYKKSLDEVNIDFRSIEDETFREEIVKELRGRVKEVKAKVFPIRGFIDIGLGIMLFVTENFLP